MSRLFFFWFVSNAIFLEASGGQGQKSEEQMDSEIANFLKVGLFVVYVERV